MDFAPWYVRYPGRLDEEIQAYVAAGLNFSIDEEWLTKFKSVVFEGVVDIDGTARQLRVIYPSSFPDLRPEVICESVELARHQGPYGRNLCVIPNESNAWNANKNGAYMVEQASALLKASHTGADAVAAGEVDAPEPMSTWYHYTPNTAFLISYGSMGTSPSDFGSFKISISNPHGVSTVKRAAGHINALLTEVREKTATVWKIQDGENVVPPIWQGEGTWFRAAGAPPLLRKKDGEPADYAEYEAWFLENHPKGGYYLTQFANKQGGVKVFGVVYPDEGPARGEYQENWLVGIKGLLGREPLLLRPFPWPARERTSRIPALRGLEDKKVLIVGLGALGSPMAEGLARAGVGHFGLIDHDFVSPGPLVRQAFDVRDLGLAKTLATECRIRTINPTAKVQRWERRLGMAQSEASDLELHGDSLGFLMPHISNYDLLVSATGEISVEQPINEMAAVLGIPSLYAWVLNGAWGGCVFRSVPGHACYECLRYHYEHLPVPEADPKALPVYARGCGFPTFTGTGFDSLAVANLAVRSAVQLLLREAEGGYADTKGNLINWASTGTQEEFYPKIDHLTVPQQDQCRTCRRYQN